MKPTRQQEIVSTQWARQREATEITITRTGGNASHTADCGFETPVDGEVGSERDVAEGSVRGR